MSGSAQKKRVLDDEDNPLSGWTMTTTTTPPRAGFAPKVGDEEHDPLQSMDESSWGSRRAVAEDIVRTLWVQPRINNAVISCSKYAQ